MLSLDEDMIDEVPFTTTHLISMDSLPGVVEMLRPSQRSRYMADDWPALSLVLSAVS